MENFRKIAEELGFENITDEDIILGIWNEMGLLDGLSEEKQLPCALKFQEAANYLIKKDDEESIVEVFKFDTTVTLFAIIRRLFNYTNLDVHNLDIETILNEYGNYKDSEEWKENYERLSKLDNIDMEAEYCYYVCEYINKKYNDYGTNE